MPASAYFNIIFKFTFRSTALIFIFLVYSSPLLALTDGDQSFEHPAIGQVLKINNKGGSGTLIAPNIVLTASHLLSSSDALRVYESVKGAHPDYTDYTGSLREGDISFIIEPSKGVKHVFNVKESISLRRHEGHQFDVGLLILDQPVPSHIAQPLKFTSQIPDGSIEIFGHGSDGWYLGPGGKYVIDKDRTFPDGAPAFRAKQKVAVSFIEDYWHMAPGDSGGPLIDKNGEIFAVNAASVDLDYTGRMERLRQNKPVVFLGYLQSVWTDLTMELESRAASSANDPVNKQITCGKILSQNF